MLRKNCITIDLNAIVHNWLIMKSTVPPRTSVMAVVKSDAYGHGMIPVARALQAVGAEHFAVATPDEAIELRQSGIAGEILILGAAMPVAAEECIRNRLTQTVFTPDSILFLDSVAKRMNQEALVHIKLDTGMNRIGLKSQKEAEALIKALQLCKHVSVKGIYTHFCDADALDSGINLFTRQQLKRFVELRTLFPKEIATHAANSAISLNCPEAFFSMVREGIALYGYPPVNTRLSFQTALEWKTEVTCVKTVLPGETIGYGRTFTVSEESRIATVSVGYGDGYHRSVSNRGMMLIHGTRVPIVGRVCMDQTMVDISNVDNVQIGDEVVLIGRQEREQITACELAAWADTIPYEVLLAPTSRVERIYCPYPNNAKGE